MRLFIAEKPSLAKAIFEGLGGDPSTQKKDGYYQKGNDVVTWCVGHVLSLYDPEDYDKNLKKWSLDTLPIAIKYPPSYKPKTGTEKQLKLILSLMEKSESLVHAGDPDAEGNLLIDEVIGYANYQKPVSRLLVADLNLEPVKQALANMEPNERFKGLTMKALARAIVDQIYGYNLTRAYTLKAQEKGYDSVLNIGRVITALIGMVNERTLANLNHTKAKYYVLHGQFDVLGKQVKAKLIPDDSFELDEKGRIASSLEASATKEADTGADAVVKNVSTAKEKKKAPSPYNLSKLQIDAAKRWGYSPSDTVKICQSLYEKHKLLTYPRSDCQYLGDTHYQTALEIMKGAQNTVAGLNDFVKNADVKLKHSAFNQSKIDAHHAIVPTGKDGSKIKLSEGEQRIYSLVARRFISLFYPESIREKTSVEFECTGRTYKASQTTLFKQGWEFVYKGEIEQTPNDNDLDISQISENTATKCNQVDIEEKETTPPKLFDEAGILTAMTKAADFIEDAQLRQQLKDKDKGKSGENGSIGTESTRGAHIEKLASLKKLVSLKKEKGYKNPVFKTTESGQQFCALLPREIVMPDISAIWEADFVRIERGEMEITDFLEKVSTYLEEKVNSVKKNGVSIDVKDAHKCPTCQQGVLTKRKSLKKKNTFWWGCNRFPDCKTTFPDDNGKPNLDPKPKSSSVGLKGFCRIYEG